MSAPKITTKAGNYYFEWEDEKVTIKVTRVKTHSDGRVLGEILIETTQPGTKQHIHQAQFNFSSTFMRDKLAGTLEKQYPNLFNWQGILESLSVHMLKLSREGEPLIELDNTFESKPPEYYLEPLILKGCANVIYGEKEQGKSTIALLSAVCMSLAWHTPIDFSVQEKPINVLYLDWEAEASITQWNLKKISNGHNLPAFKIPYLHCALPLADDLEKISNITEQKGTEVLIIDSMGPAAGVKLNTDEPAIRFFQSLRQLNTTSLIVGQTSKNQEGKKSIYGSTFFEYLARNIWQVKSSMDKDRISCGLFHEKSNYTKRHKPIGIEICHFEDSIIIDSLNLESIPEMMERMGWEVRILQALNRGALLIGDLINEMGADTKDKNTINTYLYRLKKKGKIVNLEGHKWGKASNQISEVKPEYNS